MGSADIIYGFGKGYEKSNENCCFGGGNQYGA